MFGRRHKDVDVLVVADEAVLDNGLDWAEEVGGEDMPPQRRGGRRQAVRALAPRVGAARAALSPYAATTRERLVPAVSEARQRVVPAVAGARATLVETVAPALATAVSAAVAAAREGKADRAEARRRGATALAALRGEVPRRQRRWPVALISLLAGAAAGAAAGLMARRAAAPSEPIYIPAAPPRPVPQTPPAAADPAASVTSDLGWPEQSQEPFAGSDRDAVLARDQVDLTDAEVDVTLAADSSETHKPTV